MSAENQEELMKKAAGMYYIKDMTQAEIAKKLYLSRTKVSRLLQSAKDCKIVDIVIKGERRRNTFLEALLTERFGLKDAIILSQVSANGERALDEVAAEAAEYVDSLVKEGTVIGITRGMTMRRIVEYIQPKEKVPVRVVQLIGLMNNPSHDEEEMELVRKFANAYGGTYYNLFSPFILEDNATRKVLESVAAVGKTINIAKNAQIILTSLGKVSLDDHNILWNSYLNEDEKRFLTEKKASGLFCGFYYDESGKVIDTEIHKKIIGLGIDKIVDKEYVIGVSCGNEKVIPILGALKGNLINVLITDENTALNILVKDGRMFP